MSDVITAGLLGFGGSLMSGLFGQSSADAAMAFQREAMQNRYQWTMQDLRKAGLNPMLAIGGMTGSGTPSGATARMDNPGAAAVQSAAAAKQMDIVERQQRNQDAVTASQIAANSAVKAKTDAETLNELAKHESGFWAANTDLLGSSADEKREQVLNLVSQRQLVAQQVQESQSRINQLEAQIDNIRKEGDLIRANTYKSGMEASESGSRSKLNQASARLAQAQQAVATENAKLIKAQGLAAQYDAKAKEFGLAKSAEDAYWYSNPVGQFFERTGHMIKSINPFTTK